MIGPIDIALVYVGMASTAFAIWRLLRLNGAFFAQRRRKQGQALSARNADAADGVASSGGGYGGFCGGD